MMTIFLRLFLLVPFLGIMLQPQLQTVDVNIDSPSSGEVVQGIVQVTGTAAGAGFNSFELGYTFESANATNWFSIASGSQPVSNSILGSWDTTTITDGDYSLKLTVHFTDGTQQEVIIQHILVRNYTSAGSNSTPSGMNTAGESSQLSSPGTASPSINSAALQAIDLEKSVFIGAIAGTSLVVLVGVYAAIRRWIRH